MKQKTGRRCVVCTKQFNFKHSSLEKTCSWQCEQFRVDEKEKDKERKKQKKIAPVSDKRLRQLAEYRKLRIEFLKDKVCPITKERATEVHHMNGREGERLNDISYFLGVSRYGHMWIHANPEEARLRGWLV